MNQIDLILSHKKRQKVKKSRILCIFIAFANKNLFIHCRWPQIFPVSCHWPNVDCQSQSIWPIDRRRSTCCSTKSNLRLQHCSSTGFILMFSLPFSICSELSTTIDNHYLTPIAVNESHGGGTVDFDTFDHILTVTSEHEAVYAYYYMDENNKVNNGETSRTTKLVPRN